MGFAIVISGLYIPGFIKKPMLEKLFHATADAFRVGTPSLQGLPYKDCLKLYAEFTKEQSDKLVRQGTTRPTEARLFENASRIGKEVRNRFHIRSIEEVMRVGRVLYRQLGIDFHGAASGDIQVNRCFFSAYYSRDICRLVSSLDAGVIAGLSGGGKLTFSSRITEGLSCCKAHLDLDR